MHKDKTTDGGRILPISRRSFVRYELAERRLISTGVEVQSIRRRTSCSSDIHVSTAKQI
jgi:hypothetical protein